MRGDGVAQLVERRTQDSTKSVRTPSGGQAKLIIRIIMMKKNFNRRNSHVYHGTLKIPQSISEFG